MKETTMIEVALAVVLTGLVNALVLMWISRDIYQIKRLLSSRNEEEKK